MSKRSIIIDVCDCCKKDFKKSEGEFISKLKYEMSTLSSTGSGGCGISYEDLCEECSVDFLTVMKLFWNSVNARKKI